MRVACLSPGAGAPYPMLVRGIPSLPQGTPQWVQGCVLLHQYWLRGQTVLFSSGSFGF